MSRVRILTGLVLAPIAVMAVLWLPTPWLALASAGLLLAGFAASMPMLLAGRLLQGLGAGAISVTLFVLAGRCYPETMRPRLFAAFSAAWVVPSLLGPALSGWMVDTIGWRWVFLAVPLAALPAARMLQPALRELREQADAVVTPPAYLGGETETIADTRKITVMEGAKVEWRLRVNKPVSAAELRHDNVRILAFWGQYLRRFRSRWPA